MKIGYFFSQPHQPFFLFGIVWAVVDMLVFALAYKGVLPFEVSLREFHVYSLIYIVLTHFFIGFIYTTFPRFCQSDVIPVQRYLRVFYLFQAGSVLLTLGAVLGSLLFFMGKAFLMCVFLLVFLELRSIYKTGAMARASSDPFWILTAFGFGLGANALFLLDTFFDLFGTLAIKTAFNLYLIFLVYAVAQRMVPFFSHIALVKKPYVIKVVFWLLVAKTAAGALAFSWAEIGIDILLGGFILKEFLRWKLPLFHSPAILWVLHLALFWLPAGLLLGAAGEIAAKLADAHTLFLQNHLLSIGFVTTMLIGFGTRVALGHSGQPPHADRIAVRIFWFVQAVVVVRGFYSIQHATLWGVDWLFDLSFMMWVLLFLVWGWRYAPVLYSGKKLPAR